MNLPKYELIKDLFLQGNLETFDFTEGKLHLKVMEGTSKYVAEGKGYYVIFEYNGCDLNFDEISTREKVIASFDNSLHIVEQILTDPEKWISFNLNRNPFCKERNLRNIVAEVRGE